MRMQLDQQLEQQMQSQESADMEALMAAVAAQASRQHAHSNGGVAIVDVTADDDVAGASALDAMAQSGEASAV